ncbi:MAG: endonuclease/exonuclease/phosphatase family protein [Bryobacterales bacterium]|nr:endonuclease/exonuclease/phosphatase family protein [Bryobacterales bacterium]
MLWIFLLTMLANAEPLRVLSYNVRYPSKDDGPNLWEKRRDLFIDSIRQMKPDVMGTQELFHSQGQYIVEKLPEYAWFGVSRRGNQTDEHMGVFYRKERLKVVDSGDFWLSETPEKVGSQSWNTTLPRMVTWAIFEDLANKRRFWYFNTHFPHRREDDAARLMCAKVIAARIGLLAPDADVILTGDFNAPAGGAAYKVLADRMQDAWHVADERSGPEGTFHGFRGKPGNARIDWILFRGNFRVKSAETVTFHQEGRYPSDHFPVIAVLE